MEREIINVISKIKEIAGKTEFGNKHKVKSTDFIRNRKIKMNDIIFFVLSLIKTTLPFEIMNFSNATNMPLVVPSSISKARNKLSYTAFEEILDVVLSEIPQREKFKDYQVIAIDGMQGELQKTPELVEKYETNAKTLYPMFHAVAMYDVLNKIFTKALFLPAPTDERKAAIELVSKLSADSKEIILFDRGFPSIALIQQLEKVNKKFVMRVKSNFLREVVQFIDSDKMDEIIHIDYDKRRGQTNKVFDAQLPYLFDLRCVKFILPSGEIETLVTNLWQDEFSSEDISSLYNMRWGIETSYNHLKNAVHIEDFVGIKENSIKQEFYSSLIFYNVAALFEITAQKAYDVKKNDKTPISC